jgi:voltage-gated potassium channel
MIMTTLGSEYWPQTAEGRVLCVILSLFAFAIFGYITATIASYFLGRDAEDSNASIASAGQIELLRKELAEMKQLLHDLQQSKKT